MPIEFSCACGKAFKVADEYAGKRSKCTACGQPVVVPAPPAAEESAEDAALRALLDGADAEPTGGGRYTGRAEPPTPRPTSPPPRPAPEAYTPKSRKEPPPAYFTPPQPPANKKPPPNWAKVVGGIVMAVLGLVILVVALAMLGAGMGVQRWAFIVPGPLILASPFFIIDGFRDRSKK